MTLHASFTKHLIQIIFVFQLSTKIVDSDPLAFHVLSVLYTARQATLNCDKYVFVY